MKQNCINDIAILVDGSGSMHHLRDEVVKVVNAQLQNLAVRSKETDQDTRVSIYTFNERVTCNIYSRDALRLPKFDGYSPNGGTALIDATLKAIEDLEKLPELYYDFSKLILVLTDGQENQSSNSSTTLAKKLQSLPENWTVGVFVPDAMGESEAKKFGFPSGNIKQWNVGTGGVQEVGEVIKQVTNSYMSARASGIRGTKTLFNLNTANLNSSTVSANLVPLKSSEYTLLEVRKDAVIKPFIEAWGLEFRQGMGFYELTKPETLQGYKKICIQHRLNGKVYTGDSARSLLGLPNHEVKIAPANHGDWKIFLQSTSLNRKLVAGTQLLVIR